MSLILLDANLVGLAIVAPGGRGSSENSEVEAFQDWYAATANVVHEFAVADVTRYEVRRGLMARNATAKLVRLGYLAEATLPVETTPDVWDLAADLWARLRRAGRPTSGPGSLDGDAILAATAIALAADPGQEQRVIVATTNVRHLEWFGIDARGWRDITDSI